MIEAKFRLFQMQQKGMLGHAFALLETGFGEAPEGFNAVAVRSAAYEFVLAVADAKVAVKAYVHQPVVPAPAVRIDHRGPVDFAAYNGLQGLFRAVGHDFRVHLSTAFEQAEDDGFAAAPPAAFAAHPTRAEVALVEFDRPVEFGRRRAAGQQPVAQKQVDFIDGPHAQTRESGRIRGRQIQRKQAQQVAKFDLRNFAALIIAINGLHNSKLCPFF